ncbi:MAG: restriction endonuclease subunit S [Candidatus Delongbacteria bacterium]|nr:restriction endonuclease subunit S [Candidatus Delongbacteria bacterium]
MKYKLKKIANIQTGYTFRNKIVHRDDGNFAVIQMKDLDSEYIKDNKDILKISDFNISDKHFIQNGDLLFKSRGSNNTSSIFDDKITAILSAPLLLIRINNTQILPEYLNWYIGSSIAQSYFNSISEGTSQKMINKSALENLEINIPPLEKQKLIIELARLAVLESELLDQLMKNKNKYYNNILMNIVKGD